MIYIYVYTHTHSPTWNLNNIMIDASDSKITPQRFVLEPFYLIQMSAGKRWEVY